MASLLYRLVGGKHRTVKGHTYRAKEAGNDILSLTLHQAKILGKRVLPLDGEAVEEKIKKEDKKIRPPDEVKLKAIHKGGGRYNVINQTTDQPINDNYLTKAEAEELVDGKEDMESPKDLEEPNSDLIRRRSKSESD